MADFTNKINSALNSISTYNGDTKKLSIFINSFNTKATLGLMIIKKSSRTWKTKVAQ